MELIENSGTCSR